MERILYFGIAFSVIFLIIGYVADKILNITTHLSNTEKKKWEANVLGIVFSCIAGPVGVYCNYYPQNGEVISSIYGKSDDIVLLLDRFCMWIFLIRYNCFYDIFRQSNFDSWYRVLFSIWIKQLPTTVYSSNGCFFPDL